MKDAEKKPFTIDSERAAVWYVRKLRALHDEREAIKAATAARLAELDADERRLRGLYDQQLESWTRGEAERRRRRTVTLPLAGAALQLRTVAGRLIETKDGGHVRAEIAATLGFMTEPAPDLRRYSAHAREHFATTGEALPGFEFRDAEERFAVSFTTTEGGEEPAADE